MGLRLGVQFGLWQAVSLWLYQEKEMDYDAWLFNSERDDEWEEELEATRKFYEEQRQEQEDDRNYWDWQ